jgi:hypothetical protein
MRSETRFRMVEKMDPVRFKRLLGEAQAFAAKRVAVYQQLAGLTVPRIPAGTVPVPEPAADR